MRSLRISIAAVSTLLICIGIVMIFSSSGVYALEMLGNSTYFLKRHLIFLCVGFVMAIGIMVIDYRDLRKIAKPMLLFGIIMLAFVLIPGIGHEHFGARRWFRVGPLSFQPSEYVKMAMLIYVADFLARKQNKVHDVRAVFLPLCLIIGMVCGLTIQQPDLGSTIFIATIVFLLMFVAGVDMKYLGFLGASAIPVVAFLIIKAPYRLARVISFLDPWKDAQGAGFQLSQSQIALGSGGLFGVGLGHSQQKLFYLPAAHTDFILSIIGEELGLLGTLAVVLLFFALIWQGARVAKRTQEPFGYFLSLGIVMMIGLQAVINIGVSIGALPTKGLPLPFISYGGSALVFNMLAVGLLLNISRIQDL